MRLKGREILFSSLSHLSKCQVFFSILVDLTLFSFAIKSFSSTLFWAYFPHFKFLVTEKCWRILEVPPFCFSGANVYLALLMVLSNVSSETSNFGLWLLSVAWTQRLGSTLPQIDSCSSFSWKDYVIFFLSGRKMEVRHQETGVGG